MSVVLFEPHYDDAVLFASYTLLKERPLVITVLGGDTVQEPEVTAPLRRYENDRAMNVLGLEPAEAWTLFSERAPDWDPIYYLMRHVKERDRPERIWVPLSEAGGHEQHNAVTNVAAEVFGGVLHCYATYRRGSGRTRTDYEVQPEPLWPARKYAAMACFQSQINLESTRPWFCSDDCLREWVA